MLAPSSIYTTRVPVSTLLSNSAILCSTQGVSQVAQ